MDKPLPSTVLLLKSPLYSTLRIPTRSSVLTGLVLRGREDKAKALKCPHSPYHTAQYCPRGSDEGRPKTTLGLCRSLLGCQRH